MSVHDSQERYRNLRESFDELQIQDKALFLVEATVSTRARGIEQAGQTLADEMGDVFRSEEARHHERRSPDAARPPSSERQAPHPRQKPGASDENGGDPNPASE